MIMITQKIAWWLWNQMFQYAYIKALSQRNRINFKININEYKNYPLHKYCLEYFKIKKSYSNVSEIPFYESMKSNNRYLNFILIKLRWICKKINKNHYIEKQFNFDTYFLDIKTWYIEWYFQTEKYFKDFEAEIRNDFTFALPPSEKNRTVWEDISSQNSVSLHIRRWDYITNPKANAFHGSCNLEYYKRAVKYVNTKIETPIFYIFSDDIHWVKENLVIENKAVYIDWNNADTNYEDMRLMSICKHNIIANSSFSWWGAWLNKNTEKIVIAPKKWFNSDTINTQDITPKTWIKI